MALAAPGDTWGIPGTTFLGYYLALILLVGILAAIHRRILFRGPSDVYAAGLGPQQVAYLGGRERLAIYSAIAGLRAAGAITSSGRGALAQSGPMPAGLTPLDVAIYNAAGHQVRVRDLPSDQWVVSALAQLREGLERTGMIVTAAERTMARMWTAAAFVVFLIGVFRLFAGMSNDKPVGFLVPLLFFALVFTIVTFARASAVQTRAGQKALLELRRQHTYLAPNQSPAFATYGATGAAMGVAVFGAASLYAMDPAFAAEAEIQRATASSGYSSGGTGDSGGSSSCSSGSSCGGGGGCGGGGCGG